ncbi:MAG: metallophosphoesterase family protein [Sphingomonadaceae bacterium]
MTTLFHISDLHFGREDRAALDWFAERVASDSPDAILVTGDLTMHARAHEFAAASAWLASLGRPMTIEVGNHDLPYFNPIGRMIAPYRRYQRLEAAIEKPLDLAGVAIIPLRTTARFQWRRNWSHGRVSRRRLAVTVATLRETPPETLRLITCHHPLIDKPGSHTEGRTHGGREALHALAAAGADAVLSGHVHDAFDVHWNEGMRPVRLIGAGTLSERVRTTRPSFNVLTIADNALDVRFETMA